MFSAVLYCILTVLLCFGNTYAVAMFLLCARRKRRRFFAVKFVCFMAGLVVMAVFFNLGYMRPLFGEMEHMAEYISLIEGVLRMPLIIVMMAYTVGGCVAMFSLHAKETLFYATTAYLIQHIPVTIYSTLISAGMPANVYIFFGIYVAAYVLAFFALVRRVWREEVDTSNAILLACAGISVLVIFSFEFLSTLNIQATAGLYQLFSCVIMLMLSFGFFRESKIKKEKEQLKLFLSAEQRHYDELRESMDIINIRCHDLKYKLLDLENQTDEQEHREMLGKIRDDVDFYSNINLTDCEPLNVIFADRQFTLTKNNIKFYYIGDGNALSFMQTHDVYSLFGNAIDNAIEYLQTVPDENKRIIYITISTLDGAVSVHIENYFEGKLVRDGADCIISSKKDKAGLHGFGLKSIKYIAESYGGVTKVLCEGNSFSLNMIFPLK